MGQYDRQVFLNVPFDIAHYVEFRRQLPFMCRHEKLWLSELTFLDYQQLVIKWIDVNPR